MWAMTSASFGAQILVYRVEQEVASPKVREALCEIRPFFAVVDPVFADRGLGQGRQGPLLSIEDPEDETR